MLPPSSKIVQPQATLAELTQYQVMQLYSLMSSILLDDQRRKMTKNEEGVKCQGPRRVGKQESLQEGTIVLVKLLLCTIAC